MIKNFHYRFLLAVTFITGCLFIFSAPAELDNTSWIILGGIFGIFCWLSHRTFKNLSQERINEILFADTFKKFGIDIDED